MNAVKNSVRLAGFLGSDPVFKTIARQRLARVSLAINERYKTKAGEWVDDTQWHQLIFWGDEATFARDSLKKGMYVSVQGKLLNRSYTDRTGVLREVTDIIVMEIKEVEKPASKTKAIQEAPASPTKQTRTTKKKKAAVLTND